MQNNATEAEAVKCDVCDQEVANSEEMQSHKEREHPVKERDDDQEMPASSETEQPEPVFRPVR